MHPQGMRTLPSLEFGLHSSGGTMRSSDSVQLSQGFQIPQPTHKRSSTFLRVETVWIVEEFAFKGVQ